MPILETIDEPSYPVSRLIIIGNGFDLAHQLRTGYSDFLKWFWRDFSSKWTHRFISFQVEEIYLQNFPQIDSFDYLLKEFQKRLGDRWHQRDGGYVSGNTGSRITILNRFFEFLCSQDHFNNWVDFEMAYYGKLKELARAANNTSDAVALAGVSQRLKTLNREVKEVLSVFTQYLQEMVTDNFALYRNPSIYELFENKNVESIQQEEEFLREFSTRLVRKHELESKETDVFPRRQFEDTLVLNFNYTSTMDGYLNKQASSPIHIHGKIGDQENPPILGFGDESDDDYQLLEKLNNNDFLELIKSAYYPRTKNYKRLFDFIDSSPFQVQLMGHSCALSDRTLLRSIFEHENCLSVKLFYHKFNTINENLEPDDFSYLVRNISRHFSDKKMMREKLVNKQYCLPLPQKERQSNVLGF